MSKRELTALLYSNKNIELMCKLNKQCYKFGVNLVTCLNFVELTVKTCKLKPQIIFLDLETISASYGKLQMMNDSKEFKNLKTLLVGSQDKCPNIENFENIDFSTNSGLDDYVVNSIESMNMNAIKSIQEEQKDCNMCGIVANFLLELGFSPKYSGFSYLKYIITNAMQNNGIVASLANEEYPFIAVKFKTTPETIERNIRTAIMLTYNFEHAKWEKVLGLFNTTKKPSNREFICMCVEALLCGKCAKTSNN